jgi:hypothetical protein
MLGILEAGFVEFIVFIGFIELKVKIVDCRLNSLLLTPGMLGC